MTSPEVFLWLRLKERQIGYAFNRQFRSGRYVLDFYCRKYRVAIEIDGMIHQMRRKNDEARDEWLSHQSIHVLRFSAKAVLYNSDHVVTQIKDYLDNLKANS
jgi:very-short-patch-repair endonuclease